MYRFIILTPPGAPARWQNQIMTAVGRTSVRHGRLKSIPQNPDIHHASAAYLPSPPRRSMPSGRPGSGCFPARLTHDSLVLLLFDVAGSAITQAQIDVPQCDGTRFWAIHCRGVL